MASLRRKKPKRTCWILLILEIFAAICVSWWRSLWCLPLSTIIDQPFQQFLKRESNNKWSSEDLIVFWQQQRNLGWQNKRPTLIADWSSFNNFGQPQVLIDTAKCYFRVTVTTEKHYQDPPQNVGHWSWSIPVPCLFPWLSTNGDKAMKREWTTFLIFQISKESKNL